MTINRALHSFAVTMIMIAAVVGMGAFALNYPSSVVNRRYESGIKKWNAAVRGDNLSTERRVEMINEAIMELGLVYRVAPEYRAIGKVFPDMIRQLRIIEAIQQEAGE